MTTLQITLPSQITLPLFRAKAQDHAEDLAWLISYLQKRGSGGWITAQSIKDSFLGYSDRYTRQLASESEGRIIGSTYGYKLTKYCSPEEFNEYRRRQLAQIKRMQERLIETEKVWHGRDTK